MDTVNATGLNAISAAPSTSFRARGQGSWFEAFADAWGRALDTQAIKIEQMSEKLGEGNDKPSDVTLLSAEAMRLNFISNSSHTSLDSISKALETMARKG